MSDQNEKLARALYARLMAKGDTAVTNDLLAADYLGHDIPDFPNGGGASDLVNAVLAVRSARPDITPELPQLISHGERVGVRVEAGGHHTGADFMGKGASGRPVRWKEIHHFRCVDDRIAEHYEVFDLLGIMNQPGLQ